MLLKSIFKTLHRVQQRVAFENAHSPKHLTFKVKLATDQIRNPGCYQIERLNNHPLTKKK